jgi:hypothetical protein
VVEGKLLIERWLDGDLWLHVSVGIRSGSSDVETRQFCAWFKRCPRINETEPRDGAIRNGVEPERAFLWNKDDQLQPPVLVFIGELEQDVQDVASATLLPCVVRLNLPDDCDVCTPRAGELGLDGLVEPIAGVANGEIDPLLLMLTEVRGSPALVDRPSQMFERAAVVVDDVPEEESPRDRDLTDLGKRNDDAVTLSVVALRQPEPRLVVGVSHELIDVALESVRIDYCLSPLEPGAAEGVIHGR